LTKSKVSQRGVELHFVDLSVFKNNETDKVLETARKLETTIIPSEWAQVSLFKDHLRIMRRKAINAMNMASTKIDTKIKQDSE
jgi:hypothetical protein